jgi:hypothetical protein
MSKEDIVGKTIDGKLHGIRVAHLETVGKTVIPGLSGESELLYESDGEFTFRLYDSADRTTSVRSTVYPDGDLIGCVRTIKLVNGARVHHPDLFAADLIRYFMQRIREKNPELPRIVRAEWQPELVLEDVEILSDNYRQFFLARKKGLSKVEAALSTWDGRLSSSLGFTIKSEQDVQVNNNIYVTFRKKEDKPR